MATRLRLQVPLCFTFRYSSVWNRLGLAIRKVFLQAIVSRAIGWALRPVKRRYRIWAMANLLLCKVKLRPAVWLSSYRPRHPAE